MDVFFDKTIIEQQNLIAYACDLETYEICYITQAAKAMCDFQDTRIFREKKCYQLLQGLDMPCPFCTNNKLIEEERYQWEYYNEKLEKWLAVTDTLVKYKGRIYRLEIAQDITEQKERLEHITNQLTVEETLVECIQTLSGEGDVSAAMNRFLEMIGKYYAADRAHIFEFNFNNQTVCNTFEWCAPGISQKIDHLQEIPLNYIQAWIEKLEQQGEFFVSSIGEELPANSPEYRLLKTHEIGSLSATPLIKEKQIIGFIGIDNPTVNTNDLFLLRNVSSFVLDEMERRRLIQELERSSYTDLLTGLKNRNCYKKKLNELSLKVPDTLGVIYLDINGMKQINDSYGHEHGDHIIQKVADILRYHAEDRTFRVGGDEFIVLCADITKEEFQKLTVELRSELETNQDCDVSMGCTWKSDDVSTIQEIINADDLMYAEKQGYYHSVLKHGRTTARTGMATEVLQEIADHRFEVFFQPQVDLKTLKVIGAEALVRKRNEHGQLQPPGSFIPFYEQEGIISHMDLHVLDTVCATLQAWNKEGIETRISTNFSRVTLMAPDIVTQIKKICQNYEVPPEKIIIEVTESIGKMGHQQLAELIHSFTAEGFSISLDDFGSEYSNLSILTEIDFNEVKFDKSLVDELDISDKKSIVIKHAIQICSELPATHSLAEGIETPGQLKLLRQYHCNYGQGYYFGKPMSKDAFYNILKGD